MIFHLLALGSVGPKQGAAAVNQVGTFGPHIFIYQEIFLFGTYGGQNLLGRSAQDIQHLAGRLVDWVIWINGVVISTVLVLAIPIFLLSRDIRETLRRYGVDLSADLRDDKDAAYVAAAESVFAADPSVALFVYGHTHMPSLRKIGPRCILNTGSWLTRLERVPTHFRLMPDVYYPSYELSCFTIDADGGRVRVRYRAIPKDAPDDLTLLQKLMILGKRHAGDRPDIPAEMLIE